MAQITHFFLGANSGSGFQNLFSEIMDSETAFDLMILKGGPGVGKNTFMREIGKPWSRQGQMWSTSGAQGILIRWMAWPFRPSDAPYVMGLRLTSWNRNTRRQSIDMWIWDASTTCLRQRRRRRRSSDTPMTIRTPMPAPTAA